MNYVLMDVTHISAVAEMEKLCFSDPWSVNSITSELNNPLSLWLVAMDEDKLVGYVGSQSVLGWSDMMNLAVLPDYRRQGVGEGLVKELIEKLQEQKNTCLTLEVRSSNAPAIGLYEKMGFVQDGFRKNYYNNKEHAILMTKEIEID